MEEATRKCEMSDMCLGEIQRACTHSDSRRTERVVIRWMRGVTLQASVRKGELIL